MTAPTRQRRAEYLAAALGSLWLVCAWWYWEPRVNPWIDEIFTSLTARRGVIGSWGHALQFQSQPPVYYVMSAMAWVVNPTIRGLRFVSLLGAIVTVWAMIPLGRQLRLGTRTGWLAVTCAMLPIVQTYSFEARVYTWAMAWVALHVAAMLWVMTAPSDEMPRWPVAAAVSSAVLAMLTFYYTGVVVALALGIGWVAWPDRRRRVLVMGGAVTAMMLPWIPVILRQLPTIAENYSVREATRTLPWSWKLLSEHVQAGLIGAAIGTRTSFAMVAMLGVALLLVRSAWTWRSPLSVPKEPWQRLDAPDNAVTLLVVGCGAGTLLVLLALRAGDILMMYPRYLTFLLPLLAAAGFGLIARDPRSTMRRLYWIAGAALLVGMQVSFQRNVDRRPDYRPAAEFVASHSGSGVRVLIANTETALLFLNAYHGAPAVVPLPSDTNSTRYRQRDLRVEDPVRVAGRIDTAIVNTTGFWWVRGGATVPGVAATDSLVRARSGSFVAVTDTIIRPLRLTHYLARRPLP